MIGFIFIYSFVRFWNMFRRDAVCRGKEPWYWSPSDTRNAGSTNNLHDRWNLPIDAAMLAAWFRWKAKFPSNQRWAKKATRRFNNQILIPYKFFISRTKLWIWTLLYWFRIFIVNGVNENLLIPNTCYNSFLCNYMSNQHIFKSWLR